MVMHYYKVLKNDKVIDVLNHLTYCKYQKKHNIMVVCPRSEAQAIISSDGNYIWHIKGLYAIPTNGYDTVDLVEINEYEYKQLKALNMKSPSEIIDEYTLLLLEAGVI
jgi:hypothetical protein